MKKRFLVLTFALAFNMTACQNAETAKTTEPIEATESTEADSSAEAIDVDSIMNDIAEVTTETEEVEVKESEPEIVEEEIVIEEPDVVEPEPEVVEPEIEEEVIVENTEPTELVPGKPKDENAPVNEYDADGGAIDAEYVDADGNEWTMKRTWTASNGVVLKIKDEYSHWDFENNMAARAIYGASEVIIFDGQDLRPGSPFMDAVNEFQYGTGAHEGGAEKMKISPADLPLVATPATKQTSAPKTDSWNAYVEAFNPLWKLQATGNANAIGGNLSNYGTGIGLLGGNTSTYLWNLDWIGDCWKLTIRTNPTELQWNSIRNSLRLVSPDGEALYNECYEQAYGDNPTFPEYGMWVNIGGSQAMVQAADFYYFYFK